MASLTSVFLDEECNLIHALQTYKKLPKLLVLWIAVFLHQCLYNK